MTKTTMPESQEQDPVAIAGEQKYGASEISLQSPAVSNFNVGIPAAELPLDILSYIMVLARERDAPHPCRMPFASIASQVCCAWRYVAIETGALWAWIYAAPSALCTLQAVSIFLNRSKVYPLDIAVAQVDNGIFLALLAHISRIRTLRITCQDDVWLRRYLRALTCPAPCLELLEIQCNSQMMWYDPSISVFPESPRLSSLVIGGLCLDNCQLPISYVQKLVYTLSDIGNWSQLSGTISACMAIESLTIVQLYSCDDKIAQIQVDRDAPDGLAATLSVERGVLKLWRILAPMLRSPVKALTIRDFPISSMSHIDGDYLGGLNALTLTGGYMEREWSLYAHQPTTLLGGDFLRSLDALTRLAATDGIVYWLLNLLVQLDASSALSGTAVLPRLHTLEIAPCQDNHVEAGGGGCAYSELVCKVVAGRRTAGLRLSVLVVGAAYLDVPEVHRAQWLREEVRLEVSARV